MKSYKFVILMSAMSKAHNRIMVFVKEAQTSDIHDLLMDNRQIPIFFNR